MTDNSAAALHFSRWRVRRSELCLTHMLAIPAFLTAELTAFTAVCMLFNSCVRSPVAVGTLRCSASTNLVSVMQSESIMSFDVIARAVEMEWRRNRWEESGLGSTETEIGGAEAPRYIRQGLVIKPARYRESESNDVIEFPDSSTSISSARSARYTWSFLKVHY